MSIHRQGSLIAPHRPAAHSAPHAQRFRRYSVPFISRDKPTEQLRTLLPIDTRAELRAHGRAKPEFLPQSGLTSLTIRGVAKHVRSIRLEIQKRQFAHFQRLNSPHKR